MAAETRDFTEADRAQLAERGISEPEAARQLGLLATPPPQAVLVRPCTLGDGVRQIELAERAELIAAHAEAASAGRIRSFIPASGAASRMFKDLLAAQALPTSITPAEVRALAAEGRSDAASLAQLAELLPRFAFAERLAEQLRSRGLDPTKVSSDGPWQALLSALLDTDGLDYANAPKGLLPFHRNHGVTRTAFEEHLREVPEVASDKAGRARIHFTVSSEHRERFERAFARSRGALDFGASVQDVSFSEQLPATDTLAGAVGGGAFRDDAGRLVFRPAGHGALLANLHALSADLVFIKNIDNVAVQALRGEGVIWAKLLLGLVARYHARGGALAARLRAGDASAASDAAAFLAETTGEALPSDADVNAWLLARFARPWRVAGMVPNTGEPGGGPFWVRGEGGAVTAQIVESAQVDMGNPQQGDRFRHGTHFNPVFIACALRGTDGQSVTLDRFVDDAAVIVTRKSHGGRDLLALERPGLWNGAMARWNTVFVEVPLAVFTPVKTVFDLLRPEHQGD